jgi:pimeloyl-ACP methyl ester carboxylesterase
MEPRTRYAKSGDVHIAYQVVGDGPTDLVLVPGWISHVEYYWEHPRMAHFIERLASFSRLMLIDKRGVGMSDPVSDAPTLEDRMDDVRAVMDAVGSERAALLGISEGGPMNILFAATYPERCAGLVLYGAFALGSQAPDYPWMPSEDAYQRIWARLEAGWGEGVALPIVAPELARDPSATHWWARFERLAASPGMAIAMLKLASRIDVRGVLGSIGVPTLVLHRTGDRMVWIDNGRYLAERIPGARFKQLQGSDHLFCSEGADELLDEIEEFVTGTRGASEPTRVLSTVLFTDLVGSTERAAELGDVRWRDLLASHHRRVRRSLERWQGREIKTLGDGFLATFDGPTRAIRCARAIADATRDELGTEVRAGLHTGECELIGSDVGGLAVHIGARVSSLAGAGEVLVSSTVKDLTVGSGIEFEDRGGHTLKGVPGEWRLFAVTNA